MQRSLFNLFEKIHISIMMYGFNYKFLTMIRLKPAFFFEFGKAKLKLRPFKFLVVYGRAYAQRSHMLLGN